MERWRSQFENENQTQPSWLALHCNVWIAESYDGAAFCVFDVDRVNMIDDGINKQTNYYAINNNNNNHYAINKQAN